MEDIRIIDSLISKKLITEKFDKKLDDMVYHLTKDGLAVVKEMLKNEMWKHVAEMIVKGVDDRIINLYIDNYLRCKKQQQHSFY